MTRTFDRFFFLLFSATLLLNVEAFANGGLKTIRGPGYPADKSCIASVFIVETANPT